MSVNQHSSCLLCITSPFPNAVSKDEKATWPLPLSSLWCSDPPVLWSFYHLWFAPTFHAPRHSHRHQTLKSPPPLLGLPSQSANDPVYLRSYQLRGVINSPRPLWHFLHFIVIALPLVRFLRDLSSLERRRTAELLLQVSAFGWKIVPGKHLLTQVLTCRWIRCMLWISVLKLVKFAASSWDLGFDSLIDP